MASTTSPQAAPRRAPRPWAALVVVTALWSLVAASRAEAHVTVTPPFVDADAKTTSPSRCRTSVRRTPRSRSRSRRRRESSSRAARPPSGVEARADPRSRALDGRADRRTADRRLPDRRHRAHARRDGDLRATQGYDDGESVRWDAGLTVLPAAGEEAPSQHLDRASPPAPSAWSSSPAASSCCGSSDAAHFKSDSGIRCYRRAAVLFAQILNDDLGCASYLVGCEEAGEAVVVDPPVRDRGRPRRGRAARDPHRSDDRDPHARRSRLRPRPPRARARHPREHPPRGAESSTRTIPSRTEPTSRSGTSTLRCIHTPGHRPEHCCLAVIDRTRAGRAVARADRRLPLRRRHRAARPRRRSRRGRGRAVPLAAAADGAARRGRGVPRARRRVAVRRSR